MLHKIAISTLLITILSLYKITAKDSSELDRFQHLKQKALIAGKVGHEYVYDLTGIDGCNKSRIKYLGIVKTSKGKKYKILTTFYVFRSSNDNCHGASTIEIYTIENKYVGKYHLGMPDDLPDELKNNKLIYRTNSQDCNLRKERSIYLGHGLPKSFFIKCSEHGGDIYYFSSNN